MKNRKLRYYRTSLAERRRKERIYRRNHPIASLSLDPLYPVRQYLDAKLDSLCILSKIAARERSMSCNGVIAYKLDVRRLSMTDIDIGRYFDSIAEDFARSLDSLAGQAIANAVPEQNCGHNAGYVISHYDLGTDERPVALSHANVLDHMFSLGCVVEERMHFNTLHRNMSTIVPHSLANLIRARASELRFSRSAYMTNLMPVRRDVTYIGRLANASVYADNALTGESSAVAIGCPKAIAYNFRIEIDEFDGIVKVPYGIVVLYPELTARSIFTFSGNPA